MGFGQSLQDSTAQVIQVMDVVSDRKVRIGSEHKGDIRHIESAYLPETAIYTNDFADPSNKKVLLTSYSTFSGGTGLL